MSPTCEAHFGEVPREKRGESVAGCGDIIARDGISVDAFLDDILPGSGVGGENRAAAGHRFEDGKSEAFVAGEGGHDGHALEESGEFGGGAVAVEDDAGGESDFGDFSLKLSLVVAEFWGGFTHDDDGGGGVLEKEGNGGLDEDVDAFLGADAAEDADPKFAGEAEGLPGGRFVSRQVVAIQINPVGDHNVGFFFEVGFCRRASGDDGVHFFHEPAGEAGVMALGGGGEDDFKLRSKLTGGESLDHFVVSPGVEEPGVTIFEGDEFPEANGRSVVGQVVPPHDDEWHLLLHAGKGLQHGGGDTGEALIRVAEDEQRNGHLVDGGGIVGAGCKAEPNRADEEKIAGQKFKISLDCLRNVGVIVVTESGFPKERSAQKAGKDIDKHEGRSKEARGGVGGEFLNECAKVLTVSLDLKKGEDPKGDVENFDFDSGGGLDEAIAFSDGRGNGDGAHDLIKRADVSGRPGGSKPEGGSCEEEGELEEFDDAVFSGEDRALGEPGREENSHGAGDHEGSRKKALFPGFYFGTQLGEFGVAGESGKERR